MNGETMNVSTIGIGEGIDYLRQNFISQLDVKTSEIVNNYKTLTSSGGLSSANIDSIVEGIKGRINKIEQDFDALAADLAKQMGQSQETVAAERSSTEDTLNRGV